MNTNVRRGKTILLVIICAMLLLDAIITTLVTAKFGLQRLPQGIVRFVVTATLMYFVYKGKRMVKNVIVGLLLYSIYSTIKTSNSELISNPLIIILLIVYSVSAVLLVFQKDVRCIFEEND